jgi:hypothetical protein
MKETLNKAHCGRPMGCLEPAEVYKNQGWCLLSRGNAAGGRRGLHGAR